MSSTRRRSRARTAALAVVLVGLVGAMAFSTEWLTPEEVEAIDPPAFVAAEFVDETFPEQTQTLRDEATEISVLAPTISADIGSAAEQHDGVDLGNGSFAFPVEATGTVVQVDANYALLKVPELPPRYEVRIALGNAVNGSPVRDATGTLEFGDFPDQTAFQSVANEFKRVIQDKVLAEHEPSSLEGAEVTVTGAWGTGGPPDSYIIQPVEFEVSS
jgi:predicted lipoprotein